MNKKAFYLLLVFFILLTSCRRVDYSKSITIEVGNDITKELIQFETTKEINFDEFDPFQLGTQNINFYVEETSYPLSVNVNDTKAPTVIQRHVVTIEADETINWEDYFDISDNSNWYEIISDIDTSLIESREESIIVRDASQNETQVSFELNVTTKEALIIQQEKELIVDVNTEFDINDYFTNNLDMNLSIYGDYDIDKVGYYPIEVGSGTQRLSVILTISDGSLTSSYKLIEPATIRDDLNIIVTKRYQLPQSYVPDNLVLIDSIYNPKSVRVTSDTALAFETMANAAKNEGHNLVATSGYRSYDFQVQVYNSFLAYDSQENVDTYSARPGHSEHQLGTTLDVCEGDLCFGNFTNTDTFHWMTNHAHEYGFILSYPLGKEGVHGYTYESWHYRYVGKDVATHFNSMNLTFEEYVQQFIE